MIIPFCALLVLDFTSIWAILEPQSSTRLGNKSNYVTILEGRLRSRSVTRKSMAEGRTH